MKAEPAVQRRLLDLAEVDAELNRLAHRRRTLPEHAELTEAETAVRTAKDKLVEVETGGRRPGPRHPPPRTRRRRRPRPRRPRPQMLAGSGVGRQAGHRAAARAGDPRAGGRPCWRTSSWRSWSSARRSAWTSSTPAASARTAEQAVGEIAERRDTALADIDAAEAGRRRDRERDRREPPRRPARRSTTSAASSAGTGAPPCCSAPLPGVPAGAGPHGDRRSCGRRRRTRSCTARSAE